MFRNWMRLTNEVTLGFETQRVIGLRLVRLSRGGPAAESEALRMVPEKNHCFSGSRDDPGSRWLIVEVLATETNTLTALIHVNDVRGQAVLAVFDEVIAAG
jgi:hypothetical protein